MDIIGIHLDLKGVQIRDSYFEDYLSDLAALGINSILVEYEDVFPFEGIDIAYDRDSVWTGETLAAFLALAAEYGINVIPLQQCLGHLQYLFRWPQYYPFCQKSDYPDTLDVNSSEGRDLIKNMLKQVIEAHPDSKYIHLGMDEAAGLIPAAAEKGCEVFELYCDYLSDLVDYVSKFERTPIIFTDMLEDHFVPGYLETLKGKVLLNPWDYASTGEYGPMGRFRGWRMSRRWLEHPEDTRAPAISSGTRYFEDLPNDLLEFINPYRKGEGIRSFFQIDLWSKLGFEVIGATAVRVSRDRSVMPFFNQHQQNISGFVNAIRRNGQRGIIATSWARGNTFCPPNFIIDLCWSLTEFFCRECGVDNAEPFFPGISQDRLNLLLLQLDRCKTDWSNEEDILEELKDMTPLLQSHHYDWQTLLLMIDVMAIHRKIDFFFTEVDYFFNWERLPKNVWQRIGDDHDRHLAVLEQLKEKVDQHLGQRYCGVHYQEWLRYVFDRYVDKMEFYKAKVDHYINTPDSYQKSK